MKIPRSEAGPAKRTARGFLKGTLTALSFYLLLTCASWAGGFDHQEAAARQSCATCHATAPGSSVKGASATIRFASGDAWCQTCHAEHGAMSHPHGIPAIATCGLPLDEKGCIGCLTCHTPHAPRIATEPWAPPSLDRLIDGGHRTYLLPFANPQGELCRRCHPARTAEIEGQSLHDSRAFAARAYAGSQACVACHAEIHRSWSKTPHALMLREPSRLKGFTEIASAGFEWPIERVKYVLGSHFVHRFVAEASGTMVVLPRILDRQTNSWLSVKDYGWRTRSWLKQCAGCHTTGFSAEKEQFVEMGIGCEACHGPALNHVRTQSPDFVVNPARLSADRREMICESCHTSGLDNSGVYHFPAGFKPGEDLTKFYSGLSPKPGQDTTSFSGDETYADRRRQWDFMKSRLFLAKGLTCDYCQNFRSFATASGSEYLTHDQYCMTCHLERRDHPAASPGQNCTTCHQPARTASGGYMIHDHKFRF